MGPLERAQSLPKAVEDGVRILARIIARQAVGDEVTPADLPLNSLQMEAIAERMPQRVSLASEDGGEE